jgi:hypothetical protein
MLRLLQKTKDLCYLMILLMLLPQVAASSSAEEEAIKVQNVRYEIVGLKVMIRYDLEGPLGRDYIVKLVLKREQSSSFLHFPKSVAGDVGEGSFVGVGRKIDWELLKDFSQGLEGNDFYFVIEVELKPKGTSFLWYLGGSAAVIGGVGAYFLLKGSKSEPSAQGGFPVPVGRPPGN